MKTILFPTDFSKSSLNALHYAVSFSGKMNAKLILQHVYYIVPAVDPQVPIETIEYMKREAEKNIIEKLEQLQKDVNEGKYGQDYKNIECKYICSFGQMIEEVLAYAKAKDTDLIVMGTQGASGIRKILFGSNAAHVVEKAHCPVLAVPPDKPYRNIEKMVFATDLKPKDLKIPQKTIDLIKALHAEMMFLFVDTEHRITSEEEVKEMTALIKKEVDYPKISGYICNDLDIVEGINYFIDQKKPDILIMVTHRRNFWEAIFNKSITKKIAFHLSVPLLTLHN